MSTHGMDMYLQYNQSLNIRHCMTFINRTQNSVRNRELLLGGSFPLPLFLSLTPSLFLFSYPSPFLPFPSPKIQLGVRGTAISCLSGAWGRAPAEIEFRAL